MSEDGFTQKITRQGISALALSPDAEIRVTCLVQAVQSIQVEIQVAGVPSSTAEILERARRFEEYVSGSDRVIA